MMAMNCKEPWDLAIQADSEVYFTAITGDSCVTEVLKLNI